MIADEKENFIPEFVRYFEPREYLRRNLRADSLMSVKMRNTVFVEFFDGGLAAVVQEHCKAQRWLGVDALDGYQRVFVYIIAVVRVVVAVFIHRLKLRQDFKQHRGKVR